MQLSIKNLKHINKMKQGATILFLAVFRLGFAQEIDSLQVGKTKIDGVAAVVGDFVILDSDISRTKQEFAMQKIDITKL